MTCGIAIRTESGTLLATGSRAMRGFDFKDDAEKIIEVDGWRIMGAGAFSCIQRFVRAVAVEMPTSSDDLSDIAVAISSEFSDEFEVIAVNDFASYVIMPDGIVEELKPGNLRCIGNCEDLARGFLHGRGPFPEGQKKARAYAKEALEFVCSVNIAEAPPFRITFVDQT